MGRNVYTYTGATAPNNATLTDSGNLFNESNALITKDMLGDAGMTDTYRTELLQWARGVDIDDLRNLVSGTGGISFYAVLTLENQSQWINLDGVPFRNFEVPEVGTSPGVFPLPAFLLRAFLIFSMAFSRRRSRLVLSSSSSCSQT